MLLLDPKQITQKINLNKEIQRHTLYPVNISYTPTLCKIRVKNAHCHQSTWLTYPAESPTADKLRFALGWQGPRTAANED